MLLLLILLVLLLIGAPYGYYRRADWGPAPYGVGTLLLIIVVVLLLTGWRP